jgi:hypothetical protein
MAKTSNAQRRSRTGQYESVGRTYDGVTILKQVARPKHFTYQQIRHAVAAVREQLGNRIDRDTETGRFAEPPQAPFKQK